MYLKRALLAIICLFPVAADASLLLLSPAGFVIERIIQHRRNRQDSPDEQGSHVVDADGVVIDQKAQEDSVVGTIPSEIEDIIESLRDPEKFRRFGVKPVKGVLFVGPPGTGKTSTARELARKAGAHFISAVGSEFVNMYVGVGAANVRKLFAEARDVLKKGKYKSVIIFIDEIDALAAARAERADGGNSEYNQTVNQLLSELDGFKQEENILVIAATNFESSLDAALLRPGRFDRRAYFKLPEEADRLVILKHYAKNRPVADEVNLAEIAHKTDKMSGADLKNIVNEAAIEAAREQGNSVIAQRHFDIALQKAIERLKVQNRYPRQRF